MKRIILLLIIVCSFQLGKTQVNDMALGLRFGYGGGISYQQGLSKTNRLELDGAFGIGTSYNYLRLTAAYHWVFDVGTGWNVYIGPAIAVGSLFKEDATIGKGDNGLYILGGGQFGVDYNLQNLPFQISIDILPQFAIINGYDDYYIDPALGIRYVF